MLIIKICFFLWLQLDHDFRSKLLFSKKEFFFGLFREPHYLGPFSFFLSSFFLLFFSQFSVHFFIFLFFHFFFCSFFSIFSIGPGNAGGWDLNNLLVRSKTACEVDCCRKASQTLNPKPETSKRFPKIFLSFFLVGCFTVFSLCVTFD